jgi:hypothetical protein
MLQNYIHFTEKKEIVKNAVRIYSDHEFDSFISTLYELNVDQKLSWRGMHEANLKLYNSCQRYYDRIVNNEDYLQYHDCIRNLVNYVWDWNNGTVARYLEQMEIVNDPIAIMAIMQHYGFPTPFLDFSDNAMIALYFSSTDLNYDDDEDDIRNYSSLYAIDKKVKDLNVFNEEFSINRTAYHDQFLPLLTTPLLLVSKDSPEFKIGLNLNIINQSGLFVYSNSPTWSLEESLLKPFNPAHEESKLLCWHIHKKFNNRIRLLLNRHHNINKEFVFPDFYQMIEHYHQGKH